MVALGLASLAFLPRLAKTTPRAAVALAVCVAWPLFHGLAFSFIDLGDRYAWYLTALYPTTAVAAGYLTGVLGWGLVSLIIELTWSLAPRAQ